MMIPWKQVNILFIYIILLIINFLILVIWACGFIGSYKKFIPRMAAVSPQQTKLKQNKAVRNGGTRKLLMLQAQVTPVRETPFRRTKRKKNHLSSYIVS